MKVEADLADLWPQREWTTASHRVIFHGRRVCHSRRPACGACSVARWCPSAGLGPLDPAAAARLVTGEVALGLPAETGVEAGVEAGAGAGVDR